jgi:hypothetical protein
MASVKKKALYRFRALRCYEKSLVFRKNLDFTTYNFSNGNVPQSLFKNLKILDLGNTLVVEIQKGILLYSCHHIVRKFLNIDTKHNKTQQSQNVEARRR